MIAGAIDCDVHCQPAGFDALAPYLDEYWRQYVERSHLSLTGMAAAYPPHAETSGDVPTNYAALASRLLDRDPAGPALAIVNCLTGFEIHRNDHFAKAMATALNDWVAEAFLDHDPRLRASISVPALDPVAAVEEIERRAADRRFVQVLLPVRSDEPYGKRRHHPIYAAAARARLPVALHAWGRPTAARSPNAHVTTYLEDYAANTIIVQSQLTSLVSEGVFELFPELRIVLTECGFSWLPPLLWRLDKNWKSLWREVPWLTRRPSEYVEKHFYMTIAPTHLPLDPALLREQLDLVGTCRLLYASDFPHDHGPGASELLSVLREPEATAVLSSTARELYGLDVLTRP